MGAGPDGMPVPGAGLRAAMSLSWSRAWRVLHSDAASAAAALPRAVRVVEVSPRDGLQNEPRFVPKDAKVALVRDLIDVGLRTIEVTGFVSPRWVPQLADAADVLRAVPKRSDVSYAVLVPNTRGLTAAMDAGAKEVAVFAAATETFSRRNINCSIEESMQRFRDVSRIALEANIRVRGYVSCIAGCPYEGEVASRQVADVAHALYDMGCYEVSLGDTIGVGTPNTIVRVIEEVVHAGVPVGSLAIHCHDTRGTALANVLAAMTAGVSVVDASVAGLGGCPFAPGAAGNLATEDLVYMLQGMKIDCGEIDLPRLARVGSRMCDLLGHPSRSRYALSRMDLSCASSSASNIVGKDQE